MVFSSLKFIQCLPGTPKFSYRFAVHTKMLISPGRLCFHRSGNKKHYSTETLNILVTDFLLNAMDNKRLSALILLDLSKAFDSISHSILLQKLSHIGASSSAVNRFKSYLSGRTQTVRIGSIVSTPISITNGVPQGTILSLLLFCIYFNNLPSVPHVCNLESYVDDSKIFRSFPIKDVETAKRNLENPEKTKFLLIGTTPATLHLHWKINSLISRQR